MIHVSRPVVRDDVVVVDYDVTTIVPAVTPAVYRAVDRRSPPSVRRWIAEIISSIVVVAITANLGIEPACTIAETDIPACPRVISHIKTPGKRARIIMPASPRTVVITGTVYDGWSVNISTKITGCISHIHVVWRCVVDVYVFDI